MNVKKQARSGQGSVVLWRPAVLNPDGTIRRQAVWRARISMGTANGHRLRKYLYATSERAVLEKLDKALRAQHKGELAPGRRIKVDDYLRKWLVSTKDRVRPATYLFYRQRLEGHVIPALAGRYLDSLMAADIEELLGEARSKNRYGRKDTPLSARGKQHIRAVLRNALRDAQRTRLVATNAAADARLRGAARPEVLILDSEQSRTFLAAAAGSIYEPVYLMALFLGMRQGELLGLQWEDIDWIGRTISIRHGLQRVEGSLTLVDTKSASSRRVVPMPEIVRKALVRQREQTPGQRLMAMGARGDDPDHPFYVFVTARGRPHSARNLVRDFKAILKKAGLPEIRFHDLRHSCNTLLASMGVSARDRAQLLGHSDVRLTENVYTHPLPASLRNAVDGLATILELPLKREARY